MALFGFGYGRKCMRKVNVKELARGGHHENLEDFKIFKNSLKLTK
jgi:hypothetical protein